MWNWFKLTDASFAALREAKLQDSVLEKLAPLKNMDFSKKDLTKEITQVLDTIEFELYQEHIFNNAFMLQGKARRLKRINRCLLILTGFIAIDAILLLILVNLFSLPVIVQAIMFALAAMGLCLGWVLSISRNIILLKIKPGSEEDYSEEFSILNHHPAKYKTVLLLPYPLRVRILIWLIAIAVVIGIGWANLFDCFLYLFLVIATFFFLPFALFVKFVDGKSIDSNWQPQTKKEYYVPNIRARTFWAPFLSWLAFSSAVLGLMIYEVIVCSGCFLELLSLIVLGIMWKRNCGASKRPTAGPPRNLDT